MEQLIEITSQEFLKCFVAKGNVLINSSNCFACELSSSIITVVMSFGLDIHPDTKSIPFAKIYYLFYLKYICRKISTMPNMECKL